MQIIIFHDTSVIYLLTSPQGFVNFSTEHPRGERRVKMLTNNEIVKRINHWTKKRRAHVPVCYHPEYHGYPGYEGRGRMKAVIHFGKPMLTCTNPRCARLISIDSLPKAAFKKIA